MRLFRKLFAEKILRFYEGTNAGIRYISNAPLIGRCVKEQGIYWSIGAGVYACMGIYKKILICCASYIWPVYYTGSFLPFNKNSSGYINNISVYNAF